MAGRHRSPEFVGTKRRGSSRLLVATAVVLATLLGVSGWVLAHAPQETCQGMLSFSVAADPAVVPAVQAAANRLAADRSGVNGTCVVANVLERDPARVVDQVTAVAAGQLRGRDLPDVWIPDSSLWLQLIRTSAKGRAEVPAAGLSIASSPVVVAMLRPLADRLGWPKARLGWSTFLGGLTASTPLSIAIPDPETSATGLATLLAVRQVLAARGTGRVAATAVVRTLGRSTAPTVAALTARVPSRLGTPGLQAFPADEGTVLRYNDENPVPPLAAVYPSEGALRLDFPYLTLPRAASDPGKSQAAADLLSQLTSAEGERDLFAAGLRLRDGTASATVTPARGALRAAPPRARQPTSTQLTIAQRDWVLLNRSLSSLVVVDVSGSMAEKVRENPDLTRLQATAQAAALGLGYISDDSALGLWTFSTQLSRRSDYRQLVPLGPLNDRAGAVTRREAIARWLSRIQAKRGGGTALYDTLLAAYRLVQSHWDPNRSNSVILFTDGKNDDPESISIRQLTRQLMRLADPRRPVPIFAVVFGPDADLKTLRQIARITEGAAYATDDPAQVGSLLLDGISRRTCRPRC